MGAGKMQRHDAHPVGESCVVYGMPKSAVGARLLPPNRGLKELPRFCSR